MKKLNFISGIVTKFLGMSLVIVGLLFANILVGGNSLQLNITEFYNATGYVKIIILAVIEILALYYIVIGAKNLVDSSKFINYEENRKTRLAGSIVNLVISTLLLGAEVFGIVKLVLAKFDILAVRLEVLIIAGITVLLTFVVVILALIKLIRTVNKQKKFRVVKVNKKKVSKRAPKIEVKPEIKKEEKKDLVEPKFNIGRK